MLPKRSIKQTASSYNIVENIEVKNSEEPPKMSEVGEVLDIQYGLLDAAVDRLLTLKNALYPVLATEEEGNKFGYPKDAPKQNSCSLTQEIERNNEVIVDLINSMLQILHDLRI